MAGVMSSFPNEWKGARFGVIPRVVRFDARLCDGDKLTLIDVATYLVACHGNAFPSHDVLAFVGGVTTKAIRKRLENLVCCGLIEVVPRRGRTSIYRLRDLAEVYTQEQIVAANRLPSIASEQVRTGREDATRTGRGRPWTVEERERRAQLRAEQKMRAQRGSLGGGGDQPEPMGSGSTNAQVHEGSNLHVRGPQTSGLHDEDDARSVQRRNGSREIPPEPLRGEEKAQGPLEDSPGDEVAKPSGEAHVPSSRETSRRSTLRPGRLEPPTSPPDAASPAPQVSESHRAAHAAQPRSLHQTPQPPSATETLQMTPSGHTRTASADLVTTSRHSAESPYVLYGSGDTTCASPLASGEPTDASPLAGWASAHATIEVCPAPVDAGARRVRQRRLEEAGSRLWAAWSSLRTSAPAPTREGMKRMAAEIGERGPTVVASMLRVLAVRPWSEVQAVLASADPKSAQGGGPASWSAPDLRALYALPGWRRDPITEILSRVASGEVVLVANVSRDPAAARGVRGPGQEPKFRVSRGRAQP